MKLFAATLQETRNAKAAVEAHIRESYNTKVIAPKLESLVQRKPLLFESAGADISTTVYVVTSAINCRYLKVESFS